MRRLLIGSLGVIWGGGAMMFTFVQAELSDQLEYKTWQYVVMSVGLLATIAGLIYASKGMLAMDRE